jgi:hypothetical protein
MADKWSRKVKLHKGALAKHGYDEEEGERERHEALRRSVRQDGYKTTIDRLSFIRNVANRRNNERSHRIAEQDEKWLERMHEEGMV